MLLIQWCQGTIIHWSLPSSSYSLVKMVRQRFFFSTLVSKLSPKSINLCTYTFHPHIGNWKWFHLGIYLGMPLFLELKWNCVGPRECPCLQKWSPRNFCKVFLLIKLSIESSQSKPMSINLLLSYFCHYGRFFQFCPKNIRHFWLLSRWKSDSNALHFYSSTVFYYFQPINDLYWQFEVLIFNENKSF